MTAIIKNNFRLQNARDFVENFKSGQHSTSRNHYLFIGKPTVWGTGSQSEELSPPAPNDSLHEEQRVWDEMLSLKKIDEGRVSLVIPRSDWDTSGNTIYAPYDDQDPHLYNQPTAAKSSAASLLSPPRYAGNFYAITDEYDVFVCLNNGNGSPSTEKPVRPPTSTTLVDYSEVDGYIWKYLTSVKQSDVVKFATDSWIPVKTLTEDDGSFQWLVQQAAVPGQVVSTLIDSVGTGYTRTFSGSLSSGSISNVGGKGVAVLSGSPAPSSVTDFYNNGQIHIISGPDAGSIYTIEAYNGATKQITLTEPWATSGATIVVTSASVCNILPRLNVTSNGAVAPKFRPVVSGGQITRLLTLNAGSGATYVSIVVENSLGGSGALVHPVISNSKGLGADIEEDLGASYVMMNARLEYSEGSGDFPVNNDYRQLGIIRDVKNYDGTAATASTLIATKKLNISSITGSALAFDEIIQTSSVGVKAVVLDFIPHPTIAGKGTLTFIQTPTTGYGSFSNGQAIQGTSAGTPFSATIDSVNGVINEEVKKRTGKILYLENRRPVLRAPDQIEDIKAIIEF